MWLRLVKGKSFFIAIVTTKDTPFVLKGFDATISFRITLYKGF